MAYSDYGGYAYRNGTRIEDRSDATITPDGNTFGTPGVWPGFAKYAITGSVTEGQDWPSGHVILGDGPIYVTLYKQSDVRVHRGFTKLNVVDLVVDLLPEEFDTYESGRYLNADEFRKNNKLCVLEVDDVRIEVSFIKDDNVYQYARVIQPDGTVWHGWSGYGVGAGLEDSQEHCPGETEACEIRMTDIWLDAPARSYFN